MYIQVKRFSFTPPVCIVQLIWEIVMTLRDAKGNFNKTDAKLAPQKKHQLIAFPKQL